MEKGMLYVSEHSLLLWRIVQSCVGKIPFFLKTVATVEFFPELSYVGWVCKQLEDNEKKAFTQYLLSSV